MSFLRSLLAIGFIALALNPHQAQSATLGVTPGGNLVATVADFGGGNFVLDFQGSSLIEVYNPGFVGSVLLTGGPADFGNLFLVFVEGSFTEAIAVTLDPLTTQIVGSVLSIEGALTPFGPITIAPLDIISTFSTLRFNFDFVTSADFGGATVSYLELDSVNGVPEPATWSVMAIGCVAMLRLRKRK